MGEFEMVVQIEGLYRGKPRPIFAGNALLVFPFPFGTYGLYNKGEERIRSGAMTNISRNIDVVLCIDGTGSMTPIMDDVKAKVKGFRDNLVSSVLAEENRFGIAEVRTKVIVFRDYNVDEDPMDISPWYSLGGKDDELFYQKIDSVDAHGGGDAPENGLEALWYAMQSDFTQGPRDRQVIVLITDADAHSLDEPHNMDSYPENGPAMNDIIDPWFGDPSQGMGQFHYKQARLVIYSPQNTIYEQIAKDISRCIYYPVTPNYGLADIDYERILQSIVASVCS